MADLKRTHYSAVDLATMTGRSERTLLRWAAKGILPSVRIENSRLFPAEECLKILNGEAAPDNLVSIDERRSA
jgi:predicted site-specific integrase-resolvase